MNPEAEILALLNTYDTKKLNALVDKNKLLAGGEIVKVHKKIKEIRLVSYIVSLALDVTPGVAATERLELLLKVSKPQIRTMDHQREVIFYNLIVPQMQPRVAPSCLDAFYDAERNISAILLLDLSRTHIDIGAAYPLAPTVEQCSAAVHQLAKFHASWWQRDGLEQLRLKTDVFSTENLVQMYEAFAHSMRGWFGSPQKAIYQRVLAAIETISGDLSQEQHRTLIHGDAHFGNVLYPQSPDGDTLFVDWSDWTVGNVAEDLAYMLALRHFPDQRRVLEPELLALHNRVLAQHGIKYTLDEGYHHYKRAVIKLLFLPIYQWYHQFPPEGWYYNYVRVTTAFTDLNCMDLV